MPTKHSVALLDIWSKYAKLLFLYLRVVIPQSCSMRWIESALKKILNTKEFVWALTQYIQRWSLAYWRCLALPVMLKSWGYLKWCIYREVRFFILTWCQISACRLIPQERLMYNSTDSSRSGLPGTLHGERLLLSLEYLQEQKRILNFWKVCHDTNQKPQKSFWWSLVSASFIYWHFQRAHNHGPLKRKLHSVSRFFEPVNFSSSPLFQRWQVCLAWVKEYEFEVIHHAVLSEPTFVTKSCVSGLMLEIKICNMHLVANVLDGLINNSPLYCSCPRAVCSEFRPLQACDFWWVLYLVTSMMRRFRECQFELESCTSDFPGAPWDF